MNCPACRTKAVEQGFEGARGARVLLDVCPSCHGLWFDTRESVQLSASGVLRLFRQMHGRRDQHHRLKEPLACPRCRKTMARTQDLARGNRFQYFRCPDGHGHFITFFQFLREKGIVRSLSLKELVELKKHIQMLQCSDCGGPISLEQHSDCPSCHAPVCILDPKALGSTLEELKAGAAVAGAAVAPAAAALLLMEQMKMDGFYRKLDTHAAAALGPSPLPVPGGTMEGSSAVNTALGVVDVVGTGIDLIDIGVDLFLEIAGGIGDLF